MKFNKTFVRILVFLMIAAMGMSLVGCVNSYANNPVVAKVGGVKLYLQQYSNLYQNSQYYQYMQYGLMTREQYANFIMDSLIMEGVQLDQLEVQHITLDADEEAAVQKKVDEQIEEYVNSGFLAKVQTSITDPNERYEAAFELFKAYLKENGTKFDEYRKEVENTFRQNARLDKLRELTVKDITVTTDDVKKAITDSLDKSISAADFYTAWSNFLSMSAKTAPLFMPHPERAVEDDPETSDKDESKDADPYAEFFTVKHLLIKFKTQAGDTVEDLEAYAAEDAEFSEKMKAMEESFAEIGIDEFLAKCADKETCDDPGMQTPAYKYFGYLMQASLISKYYDGFGYAAMKLRFGDEWKSDKEKQAAEENAENAEPEYKLFALQLKDGTKLVKVFTNAGVHYIVINTNECFKMYDDEGYLMLPVCENGEPVTDEEGVVTVFGGHVTSEQITAADEILKNVVASSDSEENAEEPEYITMKSMFQYYYDSKLQSEQSTYYNKKVSEWKENTKIVEKKNIIKAFYQG